MGGNVKEGEAGKVADDGEAGAGVDRGVGGGTERISEGVGISGAAG